MKLLSVKLPDLPHFGSTGLTVCDNPPALLKGFAVCVRGRAVFLVSPAGWEPGVPITSRKANGPKRTFGPLDGCILHWEGADVDGVAKYDGQPMGVPVEVLSDEDLERATAPKAVAKR